MSEREGVLTYFGWQTCVMGDECCHDECRIPVQMADEIVRLRTALATAERERDEARRERDGAIAERDNYLRMLEAAIKDGEHLRHRAERAEAEAAYIRRAFRGAVESDALAVTYKTVGSYRAGLLKTINALDAAEAP